MNAKTRRWFLAQTSLGAGAAAVVATAAPRLGPIVAAAPPAEPDAPPTGLPLDQPLVVHLRDAATAELAVMVGTQEIVYRDPEIVARLLKAVGRTAGQGG